MANLLMQRSTPPSAWTAEKCYRGISNYHNNLMGITRKAMMQLRTHLNFTQLRFHCSKQQGRTFHVTTAANSSGEAVVQYFSGRTDVLPNACGSFVRMEDDNSYLAQKCSKWGNDGPYYVGKWGHSKKKSGKRIFNHTAFVASKYDWVAVNGVWLCDDVGHNLLLISSKDFWKIYVR